MHMKPRKVEHEEIFHFGVIIVFSILVGLIAAKITIMMSNGALEQEVTRVTYKIPKKTLIEDKTAKELQLKTIVKDHNEISDCWTIIHGNVYDITEFFNDHPGGYVLEQACGKDATELFETRPMGSGTPHSEYARNLLKKFEVDLNTIDSNS